MTQITEVLREIKRLRLIATAPDHGRHAGRTAGAVPALKVLRPEDDLARGARANTLLSDFFDGSTIRAEGTQKMSWLDRCGAEVIHKRLLRHSTASLMPIDYDRENNVSGVELVSRHTRERNIHRRLDIKKSILPLWCEMKALQEERTT